jgi:hypothetical protein
MAAIVAAPAPLELRVTQSALRDDLSEALLVYDTAVDLAPAKLSSLARQRERLLRGAQAFRETIEQPETRDLVTRLAFWPEVQTVLGKAVPEDVGRLAIDELALALAQFERALTVRVYEGDKDCSDQGEISECSPLAHLVGGLHEIFLASFDHGAAKPSARLFDAFARAVMAAAGVGQAVKGRSVPAPLGDNGVRDALAAYRRWQNKT